MKYAIALALALIALSAPVMARDTTLHLPLADVIDDNLGGQLDGSVRFYLEGQRTPAVLNTLGEAMSNRKTNALNKSDVEACRWVVLSALVAMQEQAKERGANAVIGITSYYKKRTYSSDVNFECHAGALMSGVTLRGTYAKVAVR